MELSDILTKLEQTKPVGQGEYEAICPAHDDKTPSLHIKEDKGKILLHCKAGCTTQSIINALGLQMSDLFISQTQKTEVVATYDYHDEHGLPLFQVVRYKPKSFRQRHRNGNSEWVWNLDGIRRVPYQLPAIMAATSETIYFVEGERDADNLLQSGLLATTTPGGANNWKHDYAKYFTGKRVVLIPDTDSAGIAYARQVAASLTNEVAELKYIYLPGESKDISDWLDAGGEVDELPSLETNIEELFASTTPSYRLIGDKVQWDKRSNKLLLSFQAERISDERTGVHARISILNHYEPLTWSYCSIERREERSRLAGAAHALIKDQCKKEELSHDLDCFCAGLWDFYVSQFVPTEMEGDDTEQALSFLLYPYIIENGGTIIFAAPGRGKSFTGLLWAVSVDSGSTLFWQTQERKVLLINLERSKETLRRRLGMINHILGLPAKRPLLTLNARGKPLSQVIPACRKAIEKHHVGMIVLDSISRAGLGDLTENQPGNRIIDALSALCPTWVALGHTPRSNEDHIYGTIMIDAGADICVQLSSQLKDDGTLGVGWQITKQNDIGLHDSKIYAFEFGETGLEGFRPARAYEFSNIEQKKPVDMLTAASEFICSQPTGDASATQIANEFGFDRANVSRMLTKSGQFVQTRKDQRSVYYGVKTDV